MSPALSPLTLKDFLELPNIEESPAWELINQVPSQKPMPILCHSRLQKRLVAKIDSASTIYEALPEFRCVLSNNSIVPDIAITRINRLPTTNQPLAGPPDWLIEILFPDQRSTRIITKIQTCLEEGAELAWLIDPLEEIILVFQPHQPLIISRDDSILPVLNDIPLTLSAQEIFNWLQG
ncbi:Uma2 family endonuclease [Synechocystis sp. LEGE 06083]|uniref:Uma2 family endonuclease n=1 Tax=Synechocystis sp. LEGE 06083 TaxID=915336 RepID=UPI00187EA34D|nr:Uma2 family endonuclease [Synechocystis sp. LEGE 06083]MBE9196303.1 Uma2 family endonuclease [Synechocystis sp. LEGE 06083]